MKSKYFPVWFLLVSFSSFFYSFAFDRPCKEKSVGAKCFYDGECYGPNSICIRGRCACQLNFEPYALAKNIRICRPAPENIGDDCERECMPPLLCRKNKCECWQGKVVNDTCTVECPEGQEVMGYDCQTVSHLNEECESDKHCIDPFTGCVDGKCQCRKGTHNVDGSCVGFCPDGQPSRQSCSRLHSTDAELLSQMPHTDSCPEGYTCMTYNKPLIGHCCKVNCPFGTADTNKSCHAGASESQKCRRLTHYCHTVRSPGWTTAICCPRPCREPMPYYLHGKCWSNAHYDDPCQFTEQCEGGRTMVCKGKRCTCKTGYLLDPKTTFPSCKKPCTVGPINIKGIKDCLTKAGIKEHCLIDSQCPRFAKCYYGKCICQCGYQTGGLLADNICTNPDDPFNLSPFIDGVEHFFGGK